MRYCQIPLAGLLLLMFCSPDTTLADEQPITNRFSGFASIGFVSNDNPDLIFHRDVSYPTGSYDGNVSWRNDSLLGLQWQTQWSNQFETTAQLVVKDRPENKLQNALEWGFLRYRPIDSFDVRVGRMGSDVFMLSDYRHVGYALPWVRPPHDTYGVLSFHHFDGIDFLKRINLKDSTLNLKAFYGMFDQKYPLDRDEKLFYKLKFTGGGASVNWEHNEWKLHYSYADVEFSNDNTNPLVDALNATTPIWPEAADLAAKFHTKSKHLRYQQIGFIYDDNTWTAQAEMTHLNNGAGVLFGSDHFYLSAGRRIDAFTLYAITGYVHALRPPEQVTVPVGYPPALQQQLMMLGSATEFAINSARPNQSSRGVGVRWDFASKMALKFQAENFDIDKYGSVLWLKVDSTAMPKDETAHVLSLSLDMLF